jgi:DNA polymerase elongation subunit (family B)
MAAVCAEMDEISDTFEERRLGNVGVGILWRLPYGIMCIDSMYYTDKTARKSWNSISLGYMANELGLPPKLDSGTMMIDPTKSYDLTQMIIYNCRDSDLHALVPRHPRMKIPESICLLAGTSRSTIWDAIANNTGLMDFCLIQSTAMSYGLCLDLSRTMGVDETEFEGGFVLEPEPGCYKGVIQIDGNSLYGSLMAKIGIFIDRCARSSTIEGLKQKTNCDMPMTMHEMECGDVVESEKIVGMRDEDGYLAIVRGPPTMLSVILDRLIQMRTVAKADGNSELASSIKVLVCSFYGMLGSRHGAMSSKTCAEITTYLARYYLRKMVRITQSCGYTVRYGDTDSIFCEVKGKNSDECMNRGMQIKTRIYEEMKGTVFESIGADIKGNYMSILISSKKKYEAVSWDGEVETKGLAPVKKDTLPIVKFVVSKVLTVINSTMSKENKTESVIRIMSRVMDALMNDKLSVSSQVIEKKINNQPHFVYVDERGRERTIQTESGHNIRFVNKKWVMRRISIAVDRVLAVAELNSFAEVMFACRTRRQLLAKQRA